MKLPIYIILSVLASIAGAWRIDDKGRIDNFIWPQDSKYLPNFSSQQKVSFYRSHFENFTNAIGDQLTNVKELEFYEGTVLQAQLKKNIEQLYIRYSKTKKLEFDPTQEYALVELIVGYCELTNIPKYINHLRRLKKLYLHYNKIEYVQMSDLNGLKNLETLWLDGNGMKTLSSESTIDLPKLSRLDLNNNNLQEINVCSWDMLTLETFYLHKNKLKFVLNLVDQFPKLSTISMWNNPLVCQWKDNLVRSLKSKNISLYGGKATCNATDETHIPIECPNINSLSNQLSGFLERQCSFEESIGKSTKKIESLEQMVKKSTEESKAFRQHALEKQNTFEETVTTLTNQLQKMAKKLNEENKSLKQTVTTLTDQHQRLAKKSTEEIQSLTEQVTKSSTEIVLLQQTANKSNEEIHSLKQAVTTLTDQNLQMAKQSNDENQSLKQTVETLTDQLTKLRHSIDDLTEGFYRYVLEKEGGEK